ncbi:MAG TPA: tyrosine--tRNA ligase [Candidatus Levybacteria bacterium]|nr:tyrosine--tRNA ligase [Candidatus Levybacteria bacterium]
MAQENRVGAVPHSEHLQVERDRKIDEFLTRGVDQIFPNTKALKTALQSGKRLNAYMGIDPTAPELHVGHVSQLQKLKRLQDLGHNVTLLIGDFTAMIGDPTDKSAARKKLTREEVLKNAQTYKEQAAKILDFDKPGNPINLRYNSEWLGKMNFADVLELASQMTVQRMSERNMFEKRLKEGKPIGVHEFLYPLMQGWDSVAMDVDIEIGGSDQIFNMMVGRDLVKRHLRKEKFVVGGSLLVDPGGKKIGKTEGNMVTVQDNPAQMFEKIMRWGDQITPHALELCTNMPMEDIHKIEHALENGSLDPIEAKKILARTLVSELHSSEIVTTAEQEYGRASKEQTPEGIVNFPVSPGLSILDILVQSGLAKTRNSARRLIQQGGVRINGQTVSDSNLSLDGQSGEHTLQVGKKTTDSFRKLVVD